MEKYKVLVVEDQAMPRHLFELFIEQSERYQLVKSLESAELADIYCLKNPVDLILMDVLTKNGSSGLKAAERIKRKKPDIRIIIVTSMPEYSWMERARSIGVESFWYKDISKEPILSLMDRTMAGESVYPDAPPEVEIGLTTSASFSVRELEILREMTGGYKNSEIAEHLYLSVNTVKKYIQCMLDKTGFHTRTELAVKAREHGLVIIDKERLDE
ncbi:MAG: response regulator transcription factor [Lachnospiraceae bacterium]|jgi:two-component system vancomycin resistance associated response regulator VraR|nr:response regulator transcription factor [Lachnospiraceae bacterium]MCI1656361.1 response regulator transcription factor [Lachnospiraceae bacterium]MCI2194843.1 response regulator transcription factor [Lachnospiraceae bacterium]